MILRLLRALVGIGPPRISREEAMDIARLECEKRSWPFAVPVHCTLGLRTYSIVTNCNSVGGNVYIKIDILTGHVRSIGISSR